MIRTLHFHGAKLKKLLGVDSLRLDCATVEEAIKGLCAVTGKKLWAVPGQGKHVLCVVGFRTAESLKQPLPDEMSEIHIAPRMHGGKGGGLQIVVGVVLIAVAVATGPAPLFAETMFEMSTGSVFFAGASMLATGALAMMSPAPQMDQSANYSSETNPEASKYLGAPKNTVKMGTRIPIIYGKHLHGGHVLSMNVDAKDVAI